jgi:energy-coupling factor transporter ATP-binding protein EcfA2
MKGSNPYSDPLIASPKLGKGKNPFPGLRPFKIEESHLFFGREGQSDEVLLKLSKHRFVAVIGPSGSGKSSFIYCGVLPILYGGFLTGKSTEWDVVVTRPGAAPIDNLAHSLLQSDNSYTEANEEDKKIQKTIISSMLKSSSLGLVETIMQLKKNTDKNYLILVDQFEELFRFKEPENLQSVNESLAFINLLIAAINATNAPIYIAITMRSDFIGECSQFPELTRKINDSQYLIPQMTREQKRKAITGPVAVGNAEIAPRLVQQLLNDLGESADQLPILQHALMRTWDYWSDFKDYEEEPLDLKHYEAIGTMEAALSMHANEAFDELTEEQQKICEYLFKAITEKRGGNYGIRRPTSLAEIAAISGASENEVIEVIEKFREPSRSLITPQFGIPLSGHSIIDISHESIMRIWNRLKNWVNDEADAVNMYKRLADAADMYQQGKTGLWRPPDLQIASNWRGKHQPSLVWGKRYHPAYERTISFLEHSEEEYSIEQRAKELQQIRRLRTARLTALIMASATVICVLFLVYAFYQQTEAKKSESLAKEQEEIATKNANLAKIERDNAREQTIIAKNQTEVAREASIRANLEAERAEKAAKLAEERRVFAEKQEGIASQEAINARAAEKIATTEKERAELEKERAELEKSKADQLRYLAIANAIAIKATQLNDIQLKGLMAQQAYVFDKKFNDYRYDPEIYDGLYYALKSFDHPKARKIKAHQKSAKVVVAGKNENEFFTAGSQGKIVRWQKGNEGWMADTIATKRDRRVIKTLIYNAENNQLFAAGQLLRDNGESIIEQYDLNTEPFKLTELSGLKGSFIKMYQNNNRLLVLDEAGKSVKSLKDGTLTSIYESANKINDFAISNDGQSIFIASQNGEVLKTDINGGKSVLLFKNSSSISSLVKKFSFLIIGDVNGSIKVFTDNQFSTFNELAGHYGTINALKISDDGVNLLSAAKDKSVRVWNLAELTQQPLVFADHGDWVWSVDFTPNKENIISVSEDGYLHIWPFSMDELGKHLCNVLERNMTKVEWATYIAADLPYEKTCSTITSKALSYE